MTARSTSKHTCIAWALVGLVLGCASTAYGQASSDPVVLSDPSAVGLLVELVRGGGLPAVLAVLGWVAGRWGGVPVVLSLHQDDRVLLEKLIERSNDRGGPREP